MLEFYVNTKTLLLESENLKTISGKVGNIASETLKILRKTKTSAASSITTLAKDMVVFASINLCAEDTKSLSDKLFEVNEIYKSCEEQIIKSKNEKIITTSNNNRLTIDVLDDAEIEEIKNINIQEFHPLLGLTKTMMELDDNAEAMISNVPVALDAFGFFSSWLGNMNEITQLRVVKSKDEKMIIEYGTPIESNYSGKKMSLNDILVEKYYSYYPSIVFTAGSKSDECIRNWFGLDGDAKYSMQLEFGKTHIGDCGYRLIYENDELYQVPIIDDNTSIKVYYKENGENKFMFDAAEMLRHTKIKISEEESERILKQLRDNEITL